MRITSLVRLLAAAAFFSATACRVFGSDHADPMSLNVLALTPDQEANITDLHAFVIDKSGQLITDESRIAEGDRLVISLCVRRALQPNQIKLLNFDGYKFRVHLDLNPDVRFFAEDGTPEGAAYAKQLEDRNKAVTAKAAALDEAKKTGDAARIAMAQQEWLAAVTIRGALISAHESDHSMQALYGGIIKQPDALADDAIFEFELGLEEKGAKSETF